MSASPVIAAMQHSQQTQAERDGFARPIGSRAGYRMEIPDLIIDNHQDCDEPMSLECTIKWCHWRIRIPQKGKEILITDKVRILTARWEGDRHWIASNESQFTTSHTFQNYAYWAEKPSMVNRISSVTPKT